jgi:hypothetical protein
MTPLINLNTAPIISADLLPILSAFVVNINDMTTSPINMQN